MARTDFLTSERITGTEQAESKRDAQRAAKEAAKRATEEDTDLVTMGILGEAATQGFAVHESTQEALETAEVKEEPTQPVVATPPAELDAVDQIIAGLEQNNTDVSDAWEEDEEPEVEVPDFEAEAERQLLDEEIAATETGYEDEDVEDELLDTNSRKRAIIAEKKAAYYENLRAQSERSKWKTEALKHFPFSKHAVDGINAKSRRGFLKEAKAAHEAVKPYIKAAVTEREAQLEAERATLRETERAKAEEAWGKPTAGPGGGQAVSRYEEEYQAAKGRQDLAGMIAAQMKAANEEGGEE